MQDLNHEKVKEAFQKVKTDFSEIRKALNNHKNSITTLETNLVETKKDLAEQITTTEKNAQKALSNHKTGVSKRFDTLTQNQKTALKTTQNDLAELEKRVLAKFDNHTVKAEENHKTAVNGIETNRKDIAQLDANIGKVKSHIEQIEEKDIHNEKYLKTIVKREDRLDKNNTTATRLVQSLRKQKDITLQNKKDLGKLMTSTLRTDKHVEDLKTELTDAKNAYKAHMQETKKQQELIENNTSKITKHIESYEKNQQTIADTHVEYAKKQKESKKDEIEQNNTITALEKRIAKLEKLLAKQSEIKIKVPKPPKKEVKKKQKKVNKSKPKNGRGFLFNLFFEEVEEAPKQKKTSKKTKKNTLSK